MLQQQQHDRWMLIDSGNENRHLQLFGGADNNNNNNSTNTTGGGNHTGSDSSSSSNSSSANMMDNQNNDNKNIRLDGSGGANGGDFHINVYGGTVHFDGNIHFSQGGGGSRLDLGKLDGTGVDFIQGTGSGGGGGGDDGSS